MILDVGCGNVRRGDVRVDRFRYSCEIGSQEGPVKTCANVLGVGEFLPFVDRCFGKVFSVHSIEHSGQPELFLRELVRVCRGDVVVRCPHRFGSGAKRRFHRSFLNMRWFFRVLGRLGVMFEVRIVNYWSPIPYFLFLLPDEIEVMISC